MTELWQCHLADEAATQALGQALAEICSVPLVIHLSGELGAGKTTLCRSLIQSLGHSGPVKSPTYTLVETYELADRAMAHFDLYRLADPDEFGFLGADEFFDGNHTVLIEWPEKGGDELPECDILITLSRTPVQGRQVVLAANTERGQRSLAQMKWTRQ